MTSIDKTNTAHAPRRLATGMAALMLVMSLAGCQTQSGPSAAQVRQDFADAEPMSADEEERFARNVENLQALAPAMMVANSVGGLDPTGMSRMALDAEIYRRSAEVQKDIPAMMARNRQRAEAFCAANPQNADCKELARLMQQAGMTKP